MYPVLFKIGGVSVETYYVIWFIALYLMLAWVIRRFDLYGIDEDEGRSVLGWSFFGMLVGSRAFEYLWNVETYVSSPSLLLDLNSGGLSEVGALCGALLTGAFLCWRRGLPVGRMCDVAAPPAFLAVAIGRWGCFSAGCCGGVESTFPLALHFPRDPAGLTRHPTQLYYSLAAAMILALLLFIERRADVPHRKGSSVLAPVGLILFAATRFLVDPLRSEGLSKGLLLSHWTLAAAAALSVLWLAVPRFLERCESGRPPTGL
ncbi:MAG: prolipoprotein diacylglyceryl transferase [Synergistaceae bacterium]|jgi:phosphatidylglycerol:prolipoprotein diacylglycerol transferase|nr:prolipoprotein diacylglyceryl transferase [Synergistaceae bacterium]